jgi:MFS family permease
MPPLPPRVWRLLSGYGLTQVGAGFVFTFNFVYLAQARALGPAAAGAVLAASAAAGAVGLPIAGHLADRAGTGRVTAAALLVTAVGSAALAGAHTLLPAFGAAILFGLGFASTWNGLAAVYGGAVDAEQRDAVFAINNVVQNIGFGAGAALGGLIAHVAAPASFVPGFLGDAVLRVIFAGFIVAAGDAPVVKHEPQREAGRHRLLDPRLLAVTAISTVVMAGAFSQVTSSFADWTTQVTGSTALLGLALSLNALVIAVLQIPVWRWVARGRRRTRIAAAGIGLFAATWLLTLTRRPPVLVGALIVFGLGETLYVPVLPALVNDLAPERLRARYNAVFNLSNQIGPVIGPAVAGVVLAAGHGAALFVGLAVACALAAGAAIAIEPLLAAA